MCRNSVSVLYRVVFSNALNYALTNPTRGSHLSHLGISPLRNALPKLSGETLCVLGDSQARKTTPPDVIQYRRLVTPRVALAYLDVRTLSCRSCGISTMVSCTYWAC